MKMRILAAGLFTGLTLGLFQAEASAESNWASKCEAVQPNENPTYQQMNCLLTNAAIEAEIPPEVVKAVATQENGDWKQFKENGEPIISNDGGIGLMQITNKDHLNQEKLKYDLYYNIEEGIKILNSMYDRKDLPKIKGAGREVIENWYFPVMAYNGIKPINSPLHQLNGEKNTNAYQEEVFSYIKKYSYLDDTSLGQFPFKTTDFQYDTSSDKNIVFLKKEYTLTAQLHASTYRFKKGDKVFVTNEEVNLRESNNRTSKAVDKLEKDTILTITGPFKYDTDTNNRKQYVWYPVSIDGSKVKGFISSAYIANASTVNKVDDNDISISGTAPAKSTIKIMNGKKTIGTTPTTTSGKFIVEIAKPLKAKTKLTVTVKDSLNTPIPPITVSVKDETAPKPPVINPIKKNTKVVTGKTEAYATVHLKIGNKTMPGSKAKKNGEFRIPLTTLKAGTYVTATATDAAKNKSKEAKKVKVQ